MILAHECSWEVLAAPIAYFYNVREGTYPPRSHFFHHLKQGLRTAELCLLRQVGKELVKVSEERDKVKLIV